MTRPPAWRMPVTLVFSKMRTPRWRARLGQRLATLAGSAWPLAGMKSPPVTPFRSISGCLARASAGDTMWASTPNTLPMVAWRFSSSRRSADSASDSEPFWRKPVARPVSASSSATGRPSTWRAWSACSSRAAGR